MKTAVAIRHVAFEDLGSWENTISTHYDISYIDCTDPALSSLNNRKIDLLVILGGPIGVYQEKEYPFIQTEIALLQKRLQADLPTLGICLGSQLMARALGSKVYPNHTKEIGWQTLQLTDNGKCSFVRHLDSPLTSMFHWHGDTFDLPLGATLLASTEVCKNQVYTYKRNGLAFQCHPEISAQHLEKWWIGHTAELGQNNLSVNQLREQSIQLAPKLQEQSTKCVEEWLQGLTSDH